jgi:hypothetical protein
MIYCTSEFPDLKLSCSVHPRVPLENGNTKEPSISAAGFWRSTPSPTAKTRYARPLRTLSTTNTSSYGRSFVLWSFVDRLCRDWNPLIPAILGCTTGIQTWLVDTFQLFDLPFHPFLVPIWGSQSQWDVDIVEGPGGSARWYGKIDWSIDLATRVRPYRILSEICAAMHLRSFTTEGARCDLWFESARISLPALGVWNLLNVYMHGWFYYMIVGDTAFYNAHDKVIAVNSM